MVRPGTAEADARRQVGYEELPEYLQDNKFICGHYHAE
jgi:adiponectin receptor